MFRKQSIKSQDQQNLGRIKKNEETPRTATFPSGKSRSNAPISSTFPSSGSFDAPNQGCLQSLCSSNSSGTHFHSKPKCHSKIPDVPKLLRPRSKPSKENDFSRPTSRKLGKDGRSLLSRRPTSKPVQRSKLLSDLSNSSSGSEHFRLNSKNLKEKHDKIDSGIHIVLPQLFERPENSNCYESRTPFGKNNEASVESDSVSGTTSAKTPPIEASVSPEIQFAAAATPVCYGTSHLLSGVKDKRKCKSRGILITGEEMAIVEDCSSNPQTSPSFVPSPAEASMIWLSSPNHNVEKVSKSSVGCSSSSGFASDKKTRIVLISPKRFPIFHGSGIGDVDGDFSSPSSLTMASNEASCSQILEKARCSSPMVGEKYTLSTNSLSCGNVDQTPTSDFSSDHKAVQFSWTDEEELDLKAEIPRLNGPTDSSLLDNKECYDNKLEDIASCVSDSTFASILSLSGLRISWREGLGSQTFDNYDELDCCRCLSDEEYDDDQEPNLRQKSLPIAGVVKENEPLFQGGLMNVSAESICIDGDRLVASGDSDWTLSYKNHLFQD